MKRPFRSCMMFTPELHRLVSYMCMRQKLHHAHRSLPCYTHHCTACLTKLTHFVDSAAPANSFAGAPPVIGLIQETSPSALLQWLPSVEPNQSLRCNCRRGINDKEVCLLSSSPRSKPLQEFHPVDVNVISTELCT